MQKKVAITGGIGSGKSLAAAYVAKMGYPVFSCDEINKTLLLDADYVKKIAQLFPGCVLDGKIDKSSLKNKVFSNPAELEKLNKIAHKTIMERLFSAMKQSKSELVFAEVPLLFEGNYEKSFDEIIVITRNIEDRIAAVQKRDGLSKQEVLGRIAVQFDYNKLQERIKNMSVYLIDNEGDEWSLQNKIQVSLDKIKKS